MFKFLATAVEHEEGVPLADSVLGRVLASFELNWKKDGGYFQKASAIQNHWQLRDCQNKAYEDLQRCVDVPANMVCTAADYAERWAD